MKNGWRYCVVFIFCLFLTSLWIEKGFSAVHPESAVIQSIDLQSSPHEDVIVIQSDRPIDSWQDFTLESPKRVAIDLYGSQCPGALNLEKTDGRFVGGLRFARHPGKIRVAVDIKEGESGIRRAVRQEADTIEIHMGRDLDFAQNVSAQVEPVKSESPETASPSFEDSGSGVSFDESEETSPSFGQADPFGEKSEGGAQKAPWEEGASERLSPFRLSGEFRNLLAYDLKEDKGFEDDLYNRADLRLEGKYVFTPDVHAVLGLDINHFGYRNGDEWDGDVDVRLWNAYLAVAGSSYNLKVGNQIVKWGKADEVGPLDVVNPEDFRDGVIRPRSGRKVPVPMVNLELYSGMYKLQGLFVPFFKESDIDIKGRNWALFDHFEKEIGEFATEEEDYPNSLRNSGAGLRFSGTVSNLDYGFSYIRNRDSLPSIGSLTVPAGFPLPVTSESIKDLARFSHVTGQPLRLKYDRRHLAGIDFETTLGDFGLRGEFAYISNKSFLTNELENISKPVIAYVLGVDYNGPGSFYANLQFSQTLILDYDDRILFSDKRDNVINGKITKGILDDNVELSFRYLYGITHGDYYYNPAVVLKFWQNVSLEVGAEFVDGPEDTLLGVFQDNDELYAVLQWYF